jgi:hypothetical protein
MIGTMISAASSIVMYRGVFISNLFTIQPLGIYATAHVDAFVRDSIYNEPVVSAYFRKRTVHVKNESA